jgi:hypothetical protein
MFATLSIERAEACVCHWPAENSNHEFSFDMLYEIPVIVQALVTNAEEPIEWTTDQKIDMRILRSYKGCDDSLITVINHSYNSSCDPGYRVGKEYLIFLYQDSTGAYQHYGCGGVIEVKDEPSSIPEHWSARLIKQLDQLSSTSHAQVRYSNGQPIAKGSMVDGRPEGYWELYTFDGQVEFSGSFKAGQRVGLWKKFVDPRQFDGSWEYDMTPTLTKAIDLQFDKGVPNGSWSGGH